MWWRTYFWTVVLISAFGIVFGYGSQPIWTSADWMDVLISVISLLGLYSYVFKKPLFPIDFWKYFFVFTVAVSALYLLYFFTPLQYAITLPIFMQSQTLNSGQMVLLDIVISLPIYYALYKVSDLFKSLKKAKKKK